MTRPPRHVVYDCVVFAQALISPDGPAGECVNLAREGKVRLFVSEYLVTEMTTYLLHHLVTQIIASIKHCKDYSFNFECRIQLLFD